MKTEKKYVNIQNNTEQEFLRKHIKVGDTVVVIDGSYDTTEI